MSPMTAMFEGRIERQLLPQRMHQTVSTIAACQLPSWALTSIEYWESMFLLVLHC